MDSSRIAPDDPIWGAAYFEKKAGDVSPDGWREYQPLVYEVRMLDKPGAPDRRTA